MRLDKELLIFFLFCVFIILLLFITGIKQDKITRKCNEAGGVLVIQAARTPVCIKQEGILYYE